MVFNAVETRKTTVVPGLSILHDVYVSIDWNQFHQTRRADHSPSSTDGIGGVDQSWHSLQVNVCRCCASSSILIKLKGITPSISTVGILPKHVEQIIVQVRPKELALHSNRCTGCTDKRKQSNSSILGWSCLLALLGINNPGRCDKQ